MPSSLLTTLTPKASARLPLAFAALGVGYYLFAHLRKPPSYADHVAVNDLKAFDHWEMHKRDATFALVAGLGAGAALWWARAK